MVVAEYSIDQSELELFTITGRIISHLLMHVPHHVIDIRKLHCAILLIPLGIQSSLSKSMSRSLLMVCTRVGVNLNEYSA